MESSIICKFKCGLDFHQFLRRTRRGSTINTEEVKHPTIEHCLYHLFVFFMILASFCLLDVTVTFHYQILFAQFLVKIIISSITYQICRLLETVRIPCLSELRRAILDLSQLRESIKSQPANDGTIQKS